MLAARYRAQCGLRRWRERQSGREQAREPFDKRDEADAGLVAEIGQPERSISAWHTNAKKCPDAGTFEAK